MFTQNMDKCALMNFFGFILEGLPRCVTDMGERHVSGPQGIKLPQCTQAAVNGMASLYAN